MNMLSPAEFFQLYEAILRDSGLAAFLEEGQYRQIELHEIAMGCSFTAIQEQTEPPAYAIGFATENAAWLELQNPYGSLISAILYRQDAHPERLMPLYQRNYEFKIVCRYGEVKKQTPKGEVDVPLLAIPHDSYSYINSDEVSLIDLIKSYSQPSEGVSVLKESSLLQQENNGLNFIDTQSGATNFMLKLTDKFFNSAIVPVENFQVAMLKINERLPARQEKIVEALTT